jgi:hypothetical protein
VTTTELRQADHPVLVDRSDALAILGVSETTFARLCREGRFENRVCAGPPRELYMASELRRYRAQDKRLGASPKGITNAITEPKEPAPEARTQPAQLVAGAQNGLGLGNDTLRRCEGCGREFRPRRSDARTCSPTCQKRAARRRQREVA